MIPNFSDTSQMVFGFNLFLFLITFILGSIPSLLRIPPKNMNLFSIYGAGLLVGAALMIIIPEGMSVLQQSIQTSNLYNLPDYDQNYTQTQNLIQLVPKPNKNENQQQIDKIAGVSLLIGFGAILLLDKGIILWKDKQLQQLLKTESKSNFRYSSPQKFLKKSKFIKSKNNSKELTINYIEIEERTTNSQMNEESEKGSSHNYKLINFKKENHNPKQRHSYRPQEQDESKKPLLNQEFKEDDQKENISNHFRIKPMENEAITKIEDLYYYRLRRYSVDNICQMSSESENILSLSQRKNMLKASMHQQLENAADFQIYEHNFMEQFYDTRNQQVIVTTVGLVMHGLADGLALGASLFLSSKSETASGLGILIFVAILLHKAPAAIGFGTFLHHEGLRNWSLAKPLLAFTLSCPLTAVIGYFSLVIWDQEADQQKLMFWVGILLLVSAGSFLYVATIHILPEVFCNTDIHRPHEHHHLPEDHVHDEEHYSKAIELTTIIIGLATPYLLVLFYE